MEFDVAMESGNRYLARKALNSLAVKNSFDYLIREAKYKDHVLFRMITMWPVPGK